jgi:hypothetical protein
LGGGGREVSGECWLRIARTQPWQVALRRKARSARRASLSAGCAIERNDGGIGAAGSWKEWPDATREAASLRIEQGGPGKEAAGAGRESAGAGNSAAGAGKLLAG